MNIFQSIRFRIIAMCILFAFIVNLGYTQLLMLVTEESQDDVFNRYLTHNAKVWSEEYENNNNIIKTLGALGEGVFVGTEHEFIQYLLNKYEFGIENFTRLSDWSLVNHVESELHQGVLLYEVEYGHIRLHIAQALLTSSEQGVAFYTSVDITELSPQSTAEMDTLLLQVFVFIISLFAAVLIGVSLANRAVFPLSQLSKDVDAAKIGQKIVLGRQYYNDEIGLLADKLRAMFQRMESFIDREKSFSRDASHELRTPITNIQIAVELAKAMPQCADEKSQAVLNRIARSNRDMIHLVETFLLLGREDSKKEEVSVCPLYQMVEESLENNRYLLNSELLRVENHIDADMTTQQPRKMLDIVLNNLVRNAFQYTHEGSITVTGSSQYLEVRDTGIGFSYQKNVTPYTAQHESGLGLGLNIVQRICQLKGWQIEIESKVGEGSLVRVIFE